MIVKARPAKDTSNEQVMDQTNSNNAGTTSFENSHKYLASVGSSNRQSVAIFRSNVWLSPVHTGGAEPMPIIGNWNNPAMSRCNDKQAYRRIDIAEKVAERDSRRTGDLIIAYECYDCGRFHVGHADHSQRLVREGHERRGFALPTMCPCCGKPIPEERRRAAWESGNRTVYCSRKCRQKGGKKARHVRRAAREAAYSAWLDHYEKTRPQ